MARRIIDSEHPLLRRRMVEEQLRGRGIRSERLLSVMGKVPRHRFVPDRQQLHAYDDGPLPIGFEQTISQPYMVARMTELLGLKNDSRVLEVGTGSGYQTAILAEMAGQIWTVERIPALAHRAEALLRELGYANVRVLTGDGSLGLDSGAPYDAIIVAAAAPRVPQALLEQLEVGGKMVIPVTVGHSQELRLIERLADAPAPKSGPANAPAEAPPTPSSPYRETTVLRCVFVPLIGTDGYEE